MRRAIRFCRVVDGYGRLDVSARIIVIQRANNLLSFTSRSYGDLMSEPLEPEQISEAVRDLERDQREDDLEEEAELTEDIVENIREPE